MSSGDSPDHYDFLSKRIKVEIIDDSNYQSPECEQIALPVDPLQTKIEYDSESEIPIAQLPQQCKVNQENINTKTSNQENEKFESISPQREAKNIDSNSPRSNEDVKYHIQDGIWLATCYGEETTDKRIKNEEYDKFLTLNIKLSCDICLEPAETFTKLQAHVQSEHNSKAFVTCCDKQFHLRAALVDHILLHKFPKYFTCIVCSKTLTGRKTLHEHEKTHNKKLVYQCPGCEKSFHRKINLDRHKDIHVDYSERTTECPECDKL